MDRQNRKGILLRGHFLLTLSTDRNKAPGVPLQVNPILRRSMRDGVEVLYFVFTFCSSRPSL